QCDRADQGKAAKEARRERPGGRPDEAVRTFVGPKGGEQRGRLPVSRPRQPQPGQGKQAVDDEELDCQDDAEQRQRQRQRKLVGRGKFGDGGEQEWNGDRPKEPSRPGKHGGRFQIVGDADVLRHVQIRSRPPNSIIKLTGAKSVCTGAESVGTATKSLGTGAKSVGTGAGSVSTACESLGTVPVSLVPPIVPAPTAASRAAGWLNQRWDGMRTGHADDLFDRIQRVFNQRE